jgi:hypothetical protein
MDKLRAYSKCQKSKTIPNAPSQTSDPESSNTVFISDLNSSIPGLPAILIFVLHNAMESGHVLNISYLTLFPINIFYPHIIPCVQIVVCLLLKIYRWPLLIQSEGKRCRKK